ncbi:MAG: hypothetical protein ACYTG6_07115 [Planctomycetota bacterium]|jgi:hypothetical protein
MARLGPGLLIFLAALGVATGGILRPCHCDPTALHFTKDAADHDLHCRCCESQDGPAPADAPAGLKLCRTQPPAAEAPGLPLSLESPGDEAQALQAASGIRRLLLPERQVAGVTVAGPLPPPWLHTIEGLTVLLI